MTRLPSRAPGHLPAVLLALSSLASLASLQGGVAAQDLARFLPKDAQFTVVCDGPARIAERLAATNFGRLFADPDAAPIRAIPGRAREMLVKLAERESVPLDVGSLFDRLAVYGGRMAIGAHVDLAASVEAKAPRFLISFVVEPHESIDLEALAADLQRAVDESDAGTQALEFGPGFQAAIDENGDGATVPRVVDGHLVMFAGSGLGTALARIFDDHEGLGVTLPAASDESMIWGRGDGELLRFFADMAALAEEDGNPGFGDPSMPPSAILRAIFERLALTEFEAGTAPFGEHLRSVGHILTDASVPNLLDILQPQEKSTPLLALVPALHPIWTSIRIDAAGLYDLICDVAELAQPGLRGMLAESLQQEFGIDLQKDLLDAFDGQLVMLTDTFANFEGLAPGASLEDMEEVKGLYSFVLGLRDPPAFEKVLDGILRSRGLHAARKTVEYRNTKLRSMNVVVVQLHYAFVPEGIALGLGEAGAENVRKIVDQSIARAEGQAPVSHSERIQKRLALLQSGWRDLSISDIAVPSSTMNQLMDLALADLDDHAEDEFAAEFLELMRESITAYFKLASRYDQMSSAAAIRIEPGRLSFEGIQ